MFVVCLIPPFCCRLQVVMLTLYNLQLGPAGKFGFYRWKDHICPFIDKHWKTLFGQMR